MVKVNVVPLHVWHSLFFPVFNAPMRKQRQYLCKMSVTEACFVRKGCIIGSMTGFCRLVMLLWGPLSHEKWIVFQQELWHVQWVWFSRTINMSHPDVFVQEDVSLFWLWNILDTMFATGNWISVVCHSDAMKYALKVPDQQPRFLIFNNVFVGLNRMNSHQTSGQNCQTVFADLGWV